MKASGPAVIAAAKQLARKLEERHAPDALPATVDLGGREAALEAYLVAAARVLDGAVVENVAKALDTLTPCVEQGLITWSPLTRTVNHWRTEYQGRAFRLDCADLPPAERP